MSKADVDNNSADAKQAQDNMACSRSDIEGSLPPAEPDRQYKGAMAMNTCVEQLTDLEQLTNPQAQAPVLTHEFMRGNA